MIKCFFSFLMFSAFIFPQLDIPDYSSQGWTTIQDKDIWIGYKMIDNVTWCRSKTIFSHPIENIVPLLEDKKNYINVFKRLTASDILEEEIVYIRLDMPSFLSDRDYIVKYESFIEGNSMLYRWYPVNHADAPNPDNVVRLINAAGEWKITPINNKLTRVVYTWNGELLGDFPSFFLSSAWKEQGSEILIWLQEALDE